jgi:hypothetical protein
MPKVRRHAVKNGHWDIAGRRHRRDVAAVEAVNVSRTAAIGSVASAIVLSFLWPVLGDAA